MAIRKKAAEKEKDHIVWTIRATTDEDKKLMRYMKKSGLTKKVTALKAALRAGHKIL